MEDGFSVWPVHYGSEDKKTKIRVVYYKDGRVTYERIFATQKDAEKYLEKANEPV